MSNTSILIVEDESIVALDLALQLQDLGYGVSGTAASGEQALQMAWQLTPDLILMDVRLQGKIDGIEAAALLRKGHDIPVIYLTSHSDSETVQRAAATAPYGYLTKPFQIKELHAGIEVAMTKARMERQLRDADQWFVHTLRCVQDGIVVTGADAQVRFLNPAAERLTGWALEDAVGRNVAEVVQFLPRESRTAAANDKPAAEWDDPAAAVRQVIQSGRPLETSHGRRLRARGGGGVLVDESAGPVIDDGGESMGAVLVLRDAGERLAQEALLRASEERFRSAFDFAPLGMALVSLAGEFIQVNDAFCSLLGTSAVALKAAGHTAMTVAEDREHESQRLHELLGGTIAVVQFEKRYSRAQGGPVSALASVSVLHETGRPVCYLYQVHDLTQQKQAAEQLAELARERMKREASEMASTSKSEFLSRMSHELRTPLNAVLGFAQLLQMMKQPDPVMVQRYAKQIMVAGEHLLVLVGDVLDLQRVSQGTLKITMQPVNLAQTVDVSMQLLRNQAQSQGVQLQASVPADLNVMADATRLQQVLLNLGSNAVKYNRAGGSVNFSAERGPAELVRIVIQDDGIGMTPEQVEHLFQPFDRLGQEHSKIPGIGLGLVISRNLVVEMGGALGVQSQPGQGTRITLDLRAPT